MIEEEMKFSSLREFYEKKEELKAKYEGMSYGKRFVYKSYIYSREIGRNQRNIIWEYLNEPIDSEYFMQAKIDIISFKRSRQ